MTVIARKIPALRFPEFEGEWEEKRLGDIATFFSGGTPSTTKKSYYSGDIPFIKSGEINSDQTEQFLSEEGLKNSSAKMIEKGDLLYALYGATSGEVGIARISGAINQAVLCIKIEQETYFLFSFLSFKKSIIVKTYLQGGQGNLSAQIVKSFKIPLPPLPEQKKIAAFLTTIDTRIQQLSRKKALLEQFKKGVMQQIFSQEIPFKDEEGKEFPAWEEKRLSAALSVSSKRNNNLRYGKEDVLSVSGEHGIVNQITFMGRSYAGESVANYHVVEHGDIVYTKSPLKANPYGIIKVNKGAAGIVSTLYAVYQVKENFSGLYLEYYFQLDDNTNSYLRPLVRKGAKNDMKINNSHVLTGKIIAPTLSEQQKITDFLSALDRQINLASQQLNRTQTFKKGLLQQMFV
jgi:type I restriction enzyme S subunit